MTHIDDIIRELQEHDPTLRGREDELRPIIERLLAVRNDITLDASFIARLRSQLMQAPEPRSTFSALIKTPHFLMSATAFALILAATSAMLLRGGGESVNLSLTPATQSISRIGSNAFGSLALAGSSVSATDGRGGGGGLESLAAADSRLSILPGDFPYPGSIRYEYVYNSELSLTESSGTVYNKTLGLRLPSSITSALQSGSVGVVDLGNISGLSAQSVTLQNANGTYVSVDAPSGMIYLSRTTSYKRTGYEAPLAQAPSDEDILGIARNFLDEFDVDMKGYGDPSIDASAMRLMRDEIAKVGSSYVEYVNVTWPLLINDVPVRHSDGSARGVSVSVDLRAGEANSASISVVTSLEASEYELVTDTSRILQIAKRGGMYGWQPETADQTITITLGDPTFVLTPHSLYDEKSGTSRELFVPAISFPVVDTAGQSYIQNAIVIPLASDILNNVADEPIYRIMEDAATSEPATAIKEETMKIQGE